MTVPGRPPTGFGHYLRDMVYGATDGVVTTLAVIAGASGASFEPRVGLVLGLANLVADGLSMGASNYLGLKAELEQTGGSVARERPWRHGLATVAAFVLAGAMPLYAYAMPRPAGASVLTVALVLALVTLVLVGGARARVVERSVPRCALEVVAVAGGASLAAYLLGVIVAPLTH